MSTRLPAVPESPAPWVERMTVANKMLAEAAGDPQKASRVWDFAEAARVYAIQMNLGLEASNYATAVKAKAALQLAEAVDAGQREGRIATRQTTLKRGPDARPTGNGDSPKTYDELGVTSQRVSEAKKIRDAFTPESIDTAAREATEAGKPLAMGALIRNPDLYSSDTPEWYTPPEVLERVEKLFAVDLDPCSDGKTVNAAQHFTRDDDGLSQAWLGNVYMNPPYGREIEAWIEKLVAEHVSGTVPNAVALLPARTDTAWFARLRDYPKCFVAGRLKFSGHQNSAPFPSMLVYLGPKTPDFVAVFSDMGDVYGRLSP